MEADYDPNVEKDGEEPVNIEGTAQGGTSKAGKKRAKPPLSPKAKKQYPKRSWLWAHFIQRNDADPFSFCKYCQQQVGCDTKKSETSAMKGHIERYLQGLVSVEGCSELDIYLTEKAEVRVETSLGFTYDVLSWWKCNNQKFPILSAMAKDVLAIQVSSVSSKSVFSTSGRVLDSYRSSLTPYMVEVLLLTQQWLKCNFKADDEVANITQMMEDAAFFESLDSRNAQTQ